MKKLEALKSLYAALGGTSTDVADCDTSVEVLNAILALGDVDGKSEILIIRADWGVSNERRVLYTAHRTTTSHNAWEKCVAQLTTDGKKGWCKRLHQLQLLYYSLSIRVSP